MNIVSINMVVDLNKLLQDENVKVHLRDACGKQSLWVQNLSENMISEKAYNVITNYFANEKFKLTFSDDKINFWVE